MKPSRQAAALAVANALIREPRRLVDVPAWVAGLDKSTSPPAEPWWPRKAIGLVQAGLHPGARVFEFGSGRSTLWFAAQGGEVLSVEHDRAWYELVSGMLPPGPTLLLREASAEGTIGSEAAPGQFFDAYVAAIDEHPDESFDLVVVDGRARVACGMAAIPKVRPGGRLLLDDSQRERYQPLLDALRAWPRVDARGLKPREITVMQTTIWTRPA
jgi:hypothetical protein